MILVDCSIGPLSFLHVKVSGGEPREVHDNVMEEPTSTVTVDDNGESIIGRAVQKVMDKDVVMGHIHNT